MYAMLAALLLAGQPPVPPAEEVRFLPGSALVLAAADLATLSPEQRADAFYLSAYYVPTGPGAAKELLRQYRTATWVVNSLSQRVPLVPPVVVAGSGGRLLRIYLSDYGISRRAIDNLLRLGSGRTPFPEFIFHKVEVKEEKAFVELGHYEDDAGRMYAGNAVKPSERHRYKWVVTERRPTGKQAGQSFRSIQAAGLPVNETTYVIAQTGTQYPVAPLHWFCYYAPLEPRYHELLGVGEGKADVVLNDYLKFAAVDDRLADREGSITTGALLASEVSPNNRFLERTATVRRQGEGYFWSSYDFATSIRKQAVLSDLLNRKADAQELIFTLRNGLQGYGIVDGNQKRLDRAAINVARDKRNPFNSVEVEIRNCFCCHARGINPVPDAVRLEASEQVQLGLRQLEKTDKRKSERIVERYFASDLKGIIERDQQGFDRVCLGCNELSGPANALQLLQLLLEYEGSAVPAALGAVPETGAPGITLETVALELGYPTETVRGVLERAKGVVIDGLPVDPNLIALAKAKSVPIRRDLWESVHSQLAQLMLTVPVRVKR